MCPTHPCLPLQVGCSFGTRGTGGTLRYRGSGGWLRWDTGDGWDTYLYPDVPHAISCAYLPQQPFLLSPLCVIFALTKRKSPESDLSPRKGESHASVCRRRCGGS